MEIKFIVVIVVSIENSKTLNSILEYNKTLVHFFICDKYGSNNNKVFTENWDIKVFLSF